MINDNESKFIELINKIPNIAVQGYNKKREVIYWNKASERMYGFFKEEAIGKKLEDLIIPNVMKDDLIKLHKNWHEKGIPIPSGELALEKKDGSRIYVHSSHIMLGENSDFPEMFCLDIDISEQKTQESELKEIHLDLKKSLKILDIQKNELNYQANYDSLTDLPNKVLFADRLEQSIKLSRRHNNKIGILFMDLDNFKEINDSLGHHIGDKILIQVAQRIQDKMRDSDTLARLGGDEFIIILNDIKTFDDIYVFISKIMKLFKEPFIIGNNTLHTSISIGVSIYPNDGNDAMQLLRNSDAAMYEAKKSGGSNYCFYDKEMTKKALEKVYLKASLKKALKDDELIVYYQPQINAKNSSLVGMEVLVRWKHPTLGIISPDKFIPLAESSGMIIELDRIVMKKALSQLRIWKKQGLKTGKLSINLAIKQIEKDDFISFIKQLISEEKCTYDDIEFEVTEGQIMKNPEKSINILKEINDLGISIAIDDFGTGYSSLSYLRKLPINKLKIDKSFVNNLPEDIVDAAISKTIINLCKNLNLEVIAEGIETNKQKKFMLENGCNIIQGYLYSKPLSKEDMTKFLSKSVKNIN